ncbi:endo-beta-N-acetylglucosaminidase [Streptomyces sp. URMC 129]|uniref:endo-beta-N-acetylglucosaminidase n=1 Tax=Streptomyces sp. URMC 129 TaxID=3423407 RepID=UPI003F1C15D1
MMAESCSKNLISHLSAVDHPPYTPVWYPDTILQWDPKKDPDAPYNRCTVPLAERTQHTHEKFHSGTRNAKANVAACAEFAPTSNNPAQGVFDHGYYALGYWQYLDILVFWGGSSAEGTILAPNAHLVEAAHRNGVKVYGNIFFPEGQTSQHKQCVTDFLQNSNGVYPVADKLIEVADYFKFDGWFINEETYKGSTDFIGFLKYAIKKRDAGGKRVEFMWYRLAGSLGDGKFFQEKTVRVSDSMFLDYKWTKEGLKSDSKKAVDDLKRSPYDLYAGLEISRNRGNPEDASPYVSLGPFDLHAASMCRSGNARDLKKFYEEESHFWVGRSTYGDPSNVPDTARWGLAKYIVERTPVLRKPFVTNFNTGHGTAYYTRGKKVRNGGWANLSLQDVLPTYRWVVRPTRQALDPAFDFTDAFHGGSSLLLTGKIETGKDPSTVLLYQTELDVTQDTVLSVAVKTEEAGETRLSVALAFAGAATTFVPVKLGKTTGKNWEVITKPLKDHAGKKIVQIGLQTVNDTAVPAYKIRVGQIAVCEKKLKKPAGPTDFKITKKTDLTHHRKALRIQWKAATATTDAPVHHYEIYRQDGTTETYIGGTLNTVFYIPELDREGTQKETTIGVRAVGPTGESSDLVTASDTKIEWQRDESECPVMKRSTNTQ